MEAQDVADGIHDIVFDDENHERRSWKFCNNFTLPRSEVVFFIQITIVIVMIAFSCVALLLSKNCEDKTIYTAILSATIGFVIPNPKL